MQRGNRRGAMVALQLHSRRRQRPAGQSCRHRASGRTSRCMQPTPPASVSGSPSRHEEPAPSGSGWNGTVPTASGRLRSVHPATTSWRATWPSCAAWVKRSVPARRAEMTRPRCWPASPSSNAGRGSGPGRRRSAKRRRSGAQAGQPERRSTIRPVRGAGRGGIGRVRGDRRGRPRRSSGGGPLLSPSGRPGGRCPP